MAEKEEKKKVKKPTALKRIIQADKRKLQNKVFKSRTRTTLRSFEQVLNSKEKEKIQSQLCELYSFMDKGVKRGIFKPNKAARTKARAAAKVAALTR